MSELVSFYDGEPKEVGGEVDIQQQPISAAAGAQAVDGPIRTSLVYVRAPRAAGSFLVPFGDYEDWALRDRYNEALRILNALGAASITCETFGEAKVQRRLGAKLLRQGGELRRDRIVNGKFDYRHEGTGSAPRDPRPLRWPDEPGFAAAVTSVLENGVTEVEINIGSSRTYEVDGKLGGVLRKVGFDLGGSSERSAAMQLHILATFPPSHRRR